MSVQLTKENGLPRGQEGLLDGDTDPTSAPCWRGKPQSLWEALTLPIAKDPNSKVSNFFQVPESLTWLSNDHRDHRQSQRYRWERKRK